MNRHHYSLAAAWALCLPAPEAGSAGAALRRLDAQAVERARTEFTLDHARICGFGSRFAGQPGAAATAEFLEAELRAAGITQIWRQPVELVVPQTDECTLSIEGEPPVPAYPVWPNGANLAAIPRGGLTAPTVYIGHGELDDLPVDRLSGCIAVMEFNSQARWQYAAMYGARAVVFLPAEDTSWTESNGKYTYISAPFPRFYVADPALARRLRSESGLIVSLTSRAHWQRYVGHNVLGFIPGSDPDHRHVVTVLHAPYDACCVVPDLAFGAEQAINPAIALQLARRFAADPPAYSVLVAFVCGDMFELAGSRRLMSVLSHTQGWIGRDIARQEAELATLRGYYEVLSSGDPVTRLAGWDNRQLRNRHVVWQTKMKMVRLLDELRRRRRAHKAAGDGPQRRSEQERIDELEARRVRLLELQRRLHHDELREADVDLLRELLPDVLRRLERMIADCRGRLERERVDLAVLQAAGLGAGPVGDYAQGILFCSFAISSHGTRFGPFAQSYMCEKLVQNNIGPYGRALREIADRLDAPPDVRRSYQDDTADGRRHWQGDVPFPVVNGIDAAVNAGCLGMLFATTQDMRRYIDTPLDTLERVDAGQLTAQIAMLGGLLDAALRQPIPVVGSRMPCYFHERAEPNRWEGMAALAAPGESQLELGVPDVMVYGRSYDGNRDFGVRGIGVRDMIVLQADAEGKYAVDDLLHEQIRRAPLIPEVYLFDDDGRAVMAMDMYGPWLKPITGHQRRERRINLRGEMFECVQIGLFGLSDPRFLQDLDKIRVIEAARGSELRRYFWITDAGAAGVCVPTDVERWQLVFAKGDAQRRMLMLNSSRDSPEGVGFPLDWHQSSPMAFVSARDFALLNDDRLARLEATGVVDPYLHGQHEAGMAEFQAARKARDAGDGAAAWRHATAALTLQAQTYAKTRRTADDTIYAVIILLVGLVPFSYFLERLLLGATGIYRQIGGFALIFVIMTLAVGAFHPAFRISLTPVTILLAFVILFLSAVVIVIVLGKFRVELDRLRRAADLGAGTADTGGTPAPDTAVAADDFRRLDVLHRAMLLGIANMRRRRMRTGLTLITVILLAFVIMSFTSPRTGLHPLHYDLLDHPLDAPRHAVMTQRLNYGPMPAWVLDHLRTSYQHRATVVGHFWITRNDLKTEHARTFKLTGPGGRHALLATVACIDPAEARAVGLARLVGAGAMQSFAARENVIFISRGTADRIGVDGGDAVEMFGRSFTVAAVIDDRALLALTGLNGQTYAPMDYLRYGQLDPDPTRIQEKLDLLEAADSETDPSAATAERFRTLGPDQFAIIPAGQASELHATLRAVVMVPHDPADTMPLADELASRIHRPVYASADRRVLLCSAMEVTRLTGLGNVVVPLIISALIIFNTMLNCVYERHREIGILMSVGLAPAHVGALFVAEAAAYGTIGVVGGYIIGQAFGTLAGTFGLIPGLSLNFSSAAVVCTQLAIMAVVLASSLYPAYLASRTAAPGSESTWHLPAPEGDMVEVSLPFTMRDRDAGPVLAYLHDWLATHTETSLARFCSGAIEPFTDRAAQSRGLVAQIWLAPFDLGIMQTAELEIRPSPDPAIHEVRIALRREAGPHSSWIRSNRRFLTDLRKRFLLYRSLGVGRTQSYRRQAAELFGTSDAACGALTR